MWQGAWRIAKHELNLSWRGYLLTFIFLVYATFFTSFMVHSYLTGQLGDRSAGIDLSYFCLLPLLGFLMDHTLFRYWREDTYSRKLAEWQTMPIGIGQIIAGRIMLLILLLFVNVLLFFCAQYAALKELRELLDPASFVIYVLTWFGYSVISAILLVYMELGFSGRIYFGLSFVYVFALGLSALILAASGESAVIFTLEAAAAGRWEIAALSLAAAAMAVPAFGALLHRRISRRSLWT